MPFNISEFKAQIDRLGGPARASIFDVSVFNPPVVGTGIDVGNFRFFCQSARQFHTRISLLKYR